jgi:hypothetical protein
LERLDPWALHTNDSDTPTTATTGSGAVFFVFSNRLGCLGSILLSALVTALLLLLLNH